ncbi:unnamed protein product [Chrysoparadoxa australica]
MELSNLACTSPVDWRCTWDEALFIIGCFVLAGLLFVIGLTIWRYAPNMTGCQFHELDNAIPYLEDKYYKFQKWKPKGDTKKLSQCAFYKSIKEESLPCTKLVVLVHGIGHSPQQMDGQVRLTAETAIARGEAWDMLLPTMDMTSHFTTTSHLELIDSLKARIGECYETMYPSKQKPRVILVGYGIGGLLARSTYVRAWKDFSGSMSHRKSYALGRKESLRALGRGDTNAGERGWKLFRHAMKWRCSLASDSGIYDAPVDPEIVDSSLKLVGEYNKSVSDLKLPRQHVLRNSRKMLNEVKSEQSSRNGLFTADSFRASFTRDVWTDAVERIIIIGGISRGWRLGRHMPRAMLVVAYMLQLLASMLSQIPGLEFLMFEMKEGSVYVTKCRLWWLEYRKMEGEEIATQKENGEAVDKPVEVVQLISQEDWLVSPKNSLDPVDALHVGDEEPHFIYVPIPSRRELFQYTGNQQGFKDRSPSNESTPLVPLNTKKDLTEKDQLLQAPWNSNGISDGRCPEEYWQERFITALEDKMDEELSAKMYLRRCWERYSHALTDKMEGLRGKWKPLAVEDKINDKVLHVVFVLHGIRDFGSWTQHLAEKTRDQLVKQRCADISEAIANMKDQLEGPVAPAEEKEKIEADMKALVDRKREIQSIEHQADWVETVTSSYGYFPILGFLLPGSRMKKVNWFLDEYLRIKTTYPKAHVHYVGHSNGTYVVSSSGALQTCHV